MKKKLKKIFKYILLINICLIFLIIIAIVFLLVLHCYIKNISQSNLYYKRGLSIIPSADYILVPGAAISHLYPQVHLRHRLDYAYLLYTENKSSKIIVSGSYNDLVKRHEVEVMYDYLISLGINSDDIILDSEGNSTYETLKRVKDFVGDKSVILCTQELYAYRALYIAKHLKLNMYVFCSDPIIYSGLTKAKTRELLAQAKAFLNCTIFPAKVIPLYENPFHFYEEEK